MQDRKIGLCCSRKLVLLRDKYIDLPSGENDCSVGAIKHSAVGSALI